MGPPPPYWFIWFIWGGVPLNPGNPIYRGGQPQLIWWVGTQPWFIWGVPLNPGNPIYRRHLTPAFRSYSTKFAVQKQNVSFFVYNPPLVVIVLSELVVGRCIQKMTRIVFSVSISLLYIYKTRSLKNNMYFMRPLF